MTGKAILVVSFGTSYKETREKTIDALEKAVALAPGFEAPTVSPLNDPDWVAVKVMLPRKKIHDVVDALADAGARGIVVTDIRTCRL